MRFAIWAILTCKRLPVPPARAHGGQSLQALHAEITGLRLVTGTGEQLENSTHRNNDRLDGARVALGALCVLTRRGQLVERHKLRRRMWAEKHDTLLARREPVGREPQFQFFYIPFSGFSFGLTHNVEAEITPRAPDTSDAEVMQLKALRDWLGWVPSFAEILLSRAISGSRIVEDVVGESWQLLSANAMCCSTKWNITCRLIPG